MHLAIFFLVINFMALPSPAEQHTLTINFNGLDVYSGNIMLRITDDAEKVIQETFIKVKDSKNFYKVELNPGSYAVSAYHDKNSNQKLDKNFLGIPSEKYGFSNNARGTFGPPPINEQLFKLDKNSSINIQLK